MHSHSSHTGINFEIICRNSVVHSTFLWLADLVDLLSRIARTIEGSVAARARMHGRWGLRFACDFTAGFHVVLRGRCLVQCSTTNKLLDLQVGDLVFFSRGNYHDLKSDESAPCITVEEWQKRQISLPGSNKGEHSTFGPRGSSDTALAIDSDSLLDSPEETSFLSGRYSFPAGPMHPLFRTLPHYFHIRGSSLPMHDPIVNLVQLISAESSRPDSSELILGRLTDTLFHYILRHWMVSVDTTGHWSHLYSDEAVLNAIQNIEDRVDHPWTVESLARAQGLSRATLARRFKEATGLAPMEYLNQIRMQKAAELLQKSDATVEQIAMQIGYESPFSFSRSFKRTFGKAPARFRKDPSPISSAG